MRHYDFYDFINDPTLKYNWPDKAFILEEKPGLKWKFWRWYFLYIVDNYEKRKEGYEWVVSKEWEWMRSRIIDPEI